MNNRLNNKFLGLPLTGIALTGFALTNTGLLVVNKLIPMLNGSFQAEILPAAEGGILTGIMALFGVTLAVFLISYLLMAFLGVNAVRFAKNPEKVKAHTGIAKLLIVVGIISLISGIASVSADFSLSENFSLIFPSVTQLVFVASYLSEVKAVKKNLIPCA